MKFENPVVSRIEELIDLTKKLTKFSSQANDTQAKISELLIKGPQRTEIYSKINIGTTIFVIIITCLGLYFSYSGSKLQVENQDANSLELINKLDSIQNDFNGQRNSESSALKILIEEFQKSNKHDSALNATISKLINTTINQQNEIKSLKDEVERLSEQ
ncbi:MAG: hypothetical protein RI564_05680 [Gracilimonas sp.]|nr:hypothetical protein [Gracilimonas sp.]